MVFTVCIADFCVRLAGGPGQYCNTCYDALPPLHANRGAAQPTPLGLPALQQAATAPAPALVPVLTEDAISLGADRREFGSGGRNTLPPPIHRGAGARNMTIENGAENRGRQHQREDGRERSPRRTYDDHPYRGYDESQTASSSRYTDMRAPPMQSDHIFTPGLHGAARRLGIPQTRPSPLPATVEGRGRNRGRSASPAYDRGPSRGVDHRQQEIDWHGWPCKYCLDGQGSWPHSSMHCPFVAMRHRGHYRATRPCENCARIAHSHTRDDCRNE